MVDFEPGDRVRLAAASGIFSETMAHWVGLECEVLPRASAYRSNSDKTWLGPLTRRPSGGHDPFWWNTADLELVRSALPTPPRFTSIEEADAWLEQHST